MNNKFKRVVCLTLGALTAFSVVGCKKSKGKTYVNDPETTPLVFSTSALDGNFNPFFATAAPDVTIAAQTQIGMLTTDGAEVPVCGEQYPTVALDYTETMKTQAGAVTDQGDENGRTEYEFLIKNGIKFSDGTPLTIKDVLFNLYVYLDPMYSGSATIYSTKIKGLEAYRQQNPDLKKEGSVASSEMPYDSAAKEAFMLLNSDLEDGLIEDVNEDERLKKLKTFYEEVLLSDWNSYSSSLATYQEEYRFTKAWEVFLYVNGVVTIQQTAMGKNIKDNVGCADGKERYYTSLDPQHAQCSNYDDEDFTDIAEATSSENYEGNLAVHKAKYADCTCEGEVAKEHVIRDAAIERVLNTWTTTANGYYYVLNYTSAGDKWYDSVLQDAIADWKETFVGDTLVVPNIEGIKTYKTKSFNGKSYDEEHDVLKVVIDGVDPKAIWNMSFTVAPMHYYSTAELTAAANCEDSFGVKFADKDFFQNVLQAPDKNGLPVGAGVYMATNLNDSGTVDRTNFYNNNIVYYKRNPYFETVGSGLSNAKIKYMRYKVVGSDQIFNSLINNEVHVGEPNATPANVAKLSSYAHLGYGKYLTNGYGYVGINPKFVPDIEIRRIIMSAMDTTSIVKDYYTTDLAVDIQRPMSTTSWAYPTNATRPEEIKLRKTVTAITDAIPEDYTLGADGVYVNADGERLEYTFTIAGETTDHPAYSMFQKTADLLNKCGFKITVVTDPNALKKLATGNLTVWAAAWSAAIDPDMYQVYHKNSKATSVKNWGYEEIFRDEDTYKEENEIIEELSNLIDAARKTINQTVRTQKYALALDKVMELAVELPTYQRNDLVVYNKDLIDVNSINQNPTHLSGVFDKLWLVDFN